MNFDVTFSEGKTVNLSMTGDAKYSVILGTASTFVPDHSKLINRDAENQHPIKAITGLEQTLDNLVYKEFKTGSTTKHKELSDNNFTDEEKAKLAALSESASGVIVKDTTNGIDYLVKFRLINGKPVAEFDKK